MKLRSALNNGFLFLSLGAIFVGLFKVDQIDIVKFAPFLLFFVFFRNKMWLNDIFYFHNTKRNGIFLSWVGECDHCLVSLVNIWVHHRAIPNKAAHLLCGP